jgi:PhnB protein
MPKADEQGPVAGLTPHLVVNGATKAIDFYKKAFGAVELTRMPADDGKRLMHAHLKVNGASLMLCDDFPEMRGGKAVGKPAAVTLHLQVDDADKWYARAVKAGAKVAMPIADMFWGDRYGQVTDPFGHLWAIGAPLKQAAKSPAKAPAKKVAKAPAKKAAAKRV